MSLDLRGMTARKAAFALHKYLVDEFDAFEARLMCPAESRRFCGSACWRVVWEGGPFEWAVALSGGGSLAAGELGYYDRDGNCREPEVLLYGARQYVAEPYYGFDLGFYEN